MSTPVKFFGVILGVPAVVVGLLVVNAFVYPFSSKHPNFSDVDQAFSKLQFPSDWQEISSSENRGIAGRGCDPFNSSGCFHKSKTFKIPQTATEEELKKVFIQAGCTTVSTTDNTYQGELKKSSNLRCSIGEKGIYLVGAFRGPEGEAYMSATTN
jgi:hypothetical protein